MNCRDASYGTTIYYYNFDASDDTNLTQINSLNNAITHDVAFSAAYIKIIAEIVEDELLLAHYKAYVEHLRQRVSVADYDLVILRGNWSDYIPMELLRRRYQLVEQRPFVMIQGSYPLAVWRPIASVQP